VWSRLIWLRSELIEEFCEHDKGPVESIKYFENFEWEIFS